MSLFKGIGIVSEYSTKRRLKSIANELNILFSDSYLEYVLIEKFYYHLIEFLYGVPHPDFEKYDSPSRAYNFPKLIEYLEKNKNKPFYIYMHFHTSGNAFSKKAIEKVAATAKQIPEDNPQIKEVKRQLLIRIEIILKKFVGNYLVVVAVPESSLDKRSNATLYFHECMHVLFNENGFYFRAEWYYNEGLVTYFQAKYSVGGKRDMKEKLRILREMLEGQDPHYFTYALKWHEFFDNNANMSKHDVMKMVHQQHG